MFLSIGASIRTAQTASRLRRKGDPEAEQRRAFARTIPRLAATSFWREAGIERSMTQEQFRARVAPRGHDQLAGAIARMRQGEANVLWPGRCVFFAQSCGTAAGRPKFLPVTEEMLAHFRQAGLDALLCYTARVGHAGVFRGRHLLVGGAGVAPLATEKGPMSYAGDLAAILTLSLPPAAEKHFFEPGASVAKIENWDAKLEAVIARTAARDISLLAGLPETVLTLAAAVREKFAARQVARLQQLWPNLECFVHGGAPLAPHQAPLREALGPAVHFHEVYVAPEGFFAAQDAEPAAGLRLMTKAGLFFELLPMADYDEARLEHLAPKVLPLAAAKTGVDYALLVTTPGGLARYVVGDVVRFTSTQPLRLIQVGGTHTHVGAFGERVSEKELADALLAVCQRHGWTVVNFHVAPLIASNLTGQNRGRHEWWIELKAGTVATPTGPLIAAEVDAELQRTHPDYAAKRRGNIVEPPFARLVMPGVFEHWLRHHGRWGGLNKMPRCRRDRLVADELAQITNFARD